MTPSNNSPPEQVDVNEIEWSDQVTEEICSMETDNPLPKIFLIDPHGMIHDLKAGDVEKSRFVINGWIDEMIRDYPEVTAREKINEALVKVRETQTKVELTLAASDKNRFEIWMFPLPDNQILLVMQDVQDTGQPDTLDFHPLDKSQIPTLVYGSGKIEEEVRPPTQ